MSWITVRSYSRASILSLMAFSCSFAAFTAASYCSWYFLFSSASICLRSLIFSFSLSIRLMRSSSGLVACSKPFCCKAAASSADCFCASSIAAAAAPMSPCANASARVSWPFFCLAIYSLISATLLSAFICSLIASS